MLGTRLRQEVNISGELKQGQSGPNAGGGLKQGVCLMHGVSLKQGIVPKLCGNNTDNVN